MIIHLKILASYQKVSFATLIFSDPFNFSLKTMNYNEHIVSGNKTIVKSLDIL